MNRRFFYLVTNDLEKARFEPVYFESFSAAASYVESLLKENENYPVSIVKVSFNFG